jgi:hypothetical protein
MFRAHGVYHGQGADMFNSDLYHEQRPAVWTSMRPYQRDTTIQLVSGDQTLMTWDPDTEVLTLGEGA